LSKQHAGAKPVLKYLLKTLQENTDKTNSYQNQIHEGVLKNPQM